VAQTFDITARLQIQGPNNITPVVNSIRRQLGGLSSAVDIRISPAAARGVTAATASVNNLSASLSAVQAATRQVNAAMKGVGLPPSSAQGVKDLNRQAAAAVRQLQAMQKATGGASSEMFKFGEQIGLAFRRFLAFQIGAVLGISRLASGLANAAREAAEFQKTMVGLSQLGSSAAEIGGISSAISDLSRNLGVSSKELSQATIYLKGAGMSATEVRSALEALAKTSLSPTFDSIKDTTEAIIAMRQQFGVGAGDYEKYLGTINQVSKEFAAESEDLVTAIRRAGGAFKATSSDAQSSAKTFQQFIALFTAVRSTTRESADEIASGLRTVFGRLQSAQVVDTLKGMNVELRRTREEVALTGEGFEGEFVGGFEAVKRLHEALKDVPSTAPQYAEIVKQVGGFRQVSRVLPLIQQFPLALKAYTTAQTGANSLTDDAVKAQGAFLTRLTKVREEFVGLIRDIGNDKAMQALSNTFLKLAETLLKVAKFAEPVLPLLTAIAGVKIGRALYSAVLPGTQKGITNVGGARAHAYTPTRKMRSGGPVHGHGIGDSVPDMLPPGSFIIKRSSVRSAGGHGAIRSWIGGGRGSDDRRHDIPVLLEPGEHRVMPHEARKVGYGSLHRLNKTGRMPGYASGGKVLVRSFLDKVHFGDLPLDRVVNHVFHDEHDKTFSDKARSVGGWYSVRKSDRANAIGIRHDPSPQTFNYLSGHELLGHAIDDHAYRHEHGDAHLSGNVRYQSEIPGTPFHRVAWEGMPAWSQFHGGSYARDKHLRESFAHAVGVYHEQLAEHGGKRWKLMTAKYDPKTVKLLKAVDDHYLPEVQRIFGLGPRKYAEGGSVSPSAATGSISDPIVRKNFESLFGGEHAARIAGHLPEGSTFIAHGRDAVAFRRPDGDVVRIGGLGDPKFRSGPRPTDAALMIQPKETAQYGPHTVERLPYAPSLLEKFPAKFAHYDWRAAARKAYARRLKRYGKIATDVHAGNLTYYKPSKGVRGRLMAIDPGTYADVSPHNAPTGDMPTASYAEGGVIRTDRGPVKISRSGKPYRLDEYALSEGRKQPMGGIGQRTRLRRVEADPVTGELSARAAWYSRHRNSRFLKHLGRTSGGVVNAVRIGTPHSMKMKSRIMGSFHAHGYAGGTDLSGLKDVPFGELAQWVQDHLDRDVLQHPSFAGKRTPKRQATGLRALPQNKTTPALAANLGYQIQKGEKIANRNLGNVNLSDEGRAKLAEIVERAQAGGVDPFELAKVRQPKGRAASQAKTARATVPAPPELASMIGSIADIHDPNMLGETHKSYNSVLQQISPLATEESERRLSAAEKNEAYARLNEHKARLKDAVEKRADELKGLGIGRVRAIKTNREAGVEMENKGGPGEGFLGTVKGVDEELPIPVYPADQQGMPPERESGYRRLGETVAPTGTPPGASRRRLRIGSGTGTARPSVPQAGTAKAVGLDDLVTETNAARQVKREQEELAQPVNYRLRHGTSASRLAAERVAASGYVRRHPVPAIINRHEDSGISSPYPGIVPRPDVARTAEGAIPLPGRTPLVGRTVRFGVESRATRGTEGRAVLRGAVLPHQLRQIAERRQRRAARQAVAPTAQVHEIHTPGTVAATADVSATPPVAVAAKTRTAPARAARSTAAGAGGNKPPRQPRTRAGGAEPPGGDNMNREILAVLRSILAETKSVRSSAKSTASDTKKASGKTGGRRPDLAAEVKSIREMGTGRPTTGRLSRAEYETIRRKYGLTKSRASFAMATRYDIPQVSETPGRILAMQAANNARQAAIAPGLYVPKARLPRGVQREVDAIRTIGQRPAQDVGISRQTTREEYERQRRAGRRLRSEREGKRILGIAGGYSPTAAERQTANVAAAATPPAPPSAGRFAALAADRAGLRERGGRKKIDAGQATYTVQTGLPGNLAGQRVVAPHEDIAALRSLGRPPAELGQSQSLGNRVKKYVDTRVAKQGPMTAQAEAEFRKRTQRQALRELQGTDVLAERQRVGGTTARSGRQRLRQILDVGDQKSSLMSRIFQRDINPLGGTFGRVDAGGSLARVRGAARRGGNRIGKVADRLGGHAGNLGFFASAFAPQIVEQSYGTVDQPKGTREQAKYGQAAGGALTYGGIGAQVGGTFGAPGALLGGAAGAIYGFYTSLQEAEQRIKEIDFDKSFGSLRASLESAASGAEKLGDATNQVVSNLLATAGKEANRRADLESPGKNVVQRAFESIGKDPHKYDVFGLYTKSTEEAERDIGTQRQAKRSEILTPQLPQLQQIGERIASEVRLGSHQVTLPEGADQATIAARRESRIKSFQDAGGSQIAETIAEIQHIPLRQVYDNFDRIAVSANRLRIQQEGQGKVIAAATIEMTRFQEVGDAVRGAADSLHGLQAVSSGLASVFEGQVATARVGGFSGAAANVGGLDREAFQRSVSFTTGQVGGASIGNFGRVVTDIDRAMRELPGAIAKAPLNLGDTDALKGGLSKVFAGGEGGVGGLNLPREMQTRLSDAIEAMDPERLAKEVKGNPGKLAEELIKESFGDLPRVFADITKQVEERGGQFAEGLASYSQMLQKAGESRDLEGRAHLGVTQARAALAGSRQGRAPEDLVTLREMQEPIRQRQERLAGGDAFNPEAIGGRLATARRNVVAIQGRINDVQKQPGNQRDALPALLREFNAASLEASNLQRALENLADASDRSAIIQEKLNQVEKQRQGQLSYTEKLLTADPRQLMEMRRGSQAADVAVGQGGFEGFSAENIQRALEHLRSLENVKLPGYGNRTGGQVAERLIGGANRQVFGDQAAGVEQDRDNLLQQQVKIAQEAAGAQKQLSDHFASTAHSFLDNLEQQNRQFLAKMDTLIHEARLRDARGAEGRAAVTAEGKIQAVGRVEGVQGLAGTDLPQVRKILSAPEFGAFHQGRQRLDLLQQSRLNLFGARGDNGALAEEARRRPGFAFGHDFGRVAAGDADPRGAADKLRENLYSAISDIHKGTGGALSHEDIRTQVIPKVMADLGRFRSGERLTPAEAGTGQFDVSGAVTKAVDRAFKVTQGAEQERFTASQTAVGVHAFGIAEGTRGPAQETLKRVSENFDEINKSIEELPKHIRDLGGASREAFDAINKALDARKAREGVEKSQPKVAEPKASGGTVFRQRGTDTVPAMLTPGEFVVNAASTRKHLPLLRNINAGTRYYAGGGRADELTEAIAGIPSSDIPATQSVPSVKEQEERAGRSLIGEAIRNNPSISDTIKNRMAAAESARLAREEHSRDVLLPALARSPSIVVPYVAPGRRRARAGSLGRTADAYFGNLQRNINLANQQDTPFSRTAIANADRAHTDLNRKIRRYQASGMPRHAQKAVSLLSSLNQSRIMAAVNRGSSRVRPDAESREGKNRARANRLAEMSAARTAVFGYDATVPQRGTGVGMFSGGGVVPAMVSPGEFVVNARSARGNAGILGQINAGTAEYRQAGGIVGGAGGGVAIPGIHLSPGVKSTLDGFTSRFSDAVSGLGGSLGRLSSSASSLAGSLGGFNDAASSLARALSSVSIPSKIEVSSRNDVIVTLNGGAVIAAIKGDTAKAVMEAIQQQLPEQVRKIVDSLPPRA
jgi:hypothetical protein